MKKYCLLLLVFFVAADAQEGCDQDYNCCDETRFYAEILSGVNFVDNTTINHNKTTYNAGYIVATSLGYNWCYGLSLEAEYAYRRNKISKIHFFGGDHSRRGHYQSSSFMANLLWNLPSCSFWNIAPFIGAGLGYDFQKMHASNSTVIFDQKWNHFSWQLLAGLTYPIFCNTDISLEYKFHQGGNHFYNHTIGVGLIYKFGGIR